MSRFRFAIPFTVIVPSSKYGHTDVITFYLVQIIVYCASCGRHKQFETNVKSHELSRLCFPQGAHYTLSNYRRQKCGFGTSSDDEIIDLSIH